MLTSSKNNFIIVFAIALLSAACGNNAEKPSEEQVKHADSLSIKLNSPELKAVNAALLNDVNNDSLYNQRAIIYLRLRQLPEAVSDAQRAINIDSTKSRNYLTLADVYFAQNSTRLAKDLLEKVAKKFPNDTECLLKLAELYYLVQKYQEAIEFVNKALKMKTLQKRIISRALFTAKVAIPPEL